MSKKSFIIFILILLAVIGGLGWYFFFRTATTTGPDIETPAGSDLFPFGQGGTGGTNGQGTPQPATTTVVDIGGSTNTGLPHLRQLWKDQTAGAGFVVSGTTTVSVRFVDRATGHIYESSLYAVGENKLSNVTIPQVYEALVAQNGREMILRYLKDDTTIQSFYARLATSTTDANPIEGFFLPQNIKDISLLGNKVLYFDPTTETGNLLQSNIDGSKRALITSSKLNDWSLSWNASTTAFLYTRPSGTVPGYGYILDIAKGTITKAIGNIAGLSGSMSPRGDYVFLSAQEGKGIASAIYNVKTKTTLDLSLNTLADKCTWANKTKTTIYCAIPGNVPQGTYPDAWYQGLVSFNDRISAINAVTGATELILDPSFDAIQDMDIEKLSIDPTDTYILFTNKKDMSLWMYKL